MGLAILLELSFPATWLKLLLQYGWNLSPASSPVAVAAPTVVVALGAALGVRSLPDAHHCLHVIFHGFFKRVPEDH